MRIALLYLIIAVLVLVGMVMLVLLTAGFLSLRKAYIVRKSREMQPDQSPVAFVDVNVVRLVSSKDHLVGSILNRTRNRWGTIL